MFFESFESPPTSPNTKATLFSDAGSVAPRRKWTDLFPEYEHDLRMWQITVGHRDTFKASTRNPREFCPQDGRLRSTHTQSVPAYREQVAPSEDAGHDPLSPIVLPSLAPAYIWPSRNEISYDTPFSLGEASRWSDSSSSDDESSCGSFFDARENPVRPSYLEILAIHFDERSSRDMESPSSTTGVFHDALDEFGDDAFERFYSPVEENPIDFQLVKDRQLSRRERNSRPGSVPFSSTADLVEETDKHTALANDSLSN